MRDAVNQNKRLEWTEHFFSNCNVGFLVHQQEMQKKMIMYVCQKLRVLKYILFL